MTPRRILAAAVALLLTGCGGTDSWPAGHRTHAGCKVERDRDVECKDGHELDYADGKRKAQSAKRKPRPARRARR